MKSSILLISLLFVLGACSFDIDSDGTFVLFNAVTETADPPDDVASSTFDQWKDFDWAELVVSGGPNGVESFKRKIEETPKTLSVVFPVKGLQVGYKYSFKIWGYEKNPNSNSAIGTLIGELADVLISESTNVIRIPPKTARVAID